ncbi:MAG: 2-oxoglutarate ferredoxin oxidoreductase subunit alpha, partial [Magnetovibrio sp.]|nr:2-oxoglutarate ferredoxin oxidoreductase subunit alpha [Magnetovibrio sp.]
MNLIDKNVLLNQPDREEVESAVVRLAGDSGDGMQLTGGQFTLATALAGNDLATFPDFPAEIRAPAGTTFGVSSFQINFGSRAIKTSGDSFDVLVAMNPAALKVELKGLKTSGMILADTGSFTDRNFRKAGYERNPLEDGSLNAYRLVALDISQLTMDSVKEYGLTNKEALRCKNLWTLGFVYWMFGRKRQATSDWLHAKFSKRPELASANIAALNAGHAFAETAEVLDGFQGFAVPPAAISPGQYRAVTGAEAMAWGLAAGCQLAELEMIFCSYPITPASSVLHTLSNMTAFGVTTFQAEDEIAAACAAIGASYAGGMGVTSSSGPGIALKGEAIGLAIST